MAKEMWYFTFRAGHKHYGKYVKILGNMKTTKEEMDRKYGEYSHDVQYSYELWHEKGASRARLFGLKELKQRKQ